MQFRAPTSEPQSEAIGPTDRLPRALQRALEPRNDFEPLPTPGPSDWLANHREAGQTFDQFVRSHPNRPNQRFRKLYLQPIGSFRQDNAPELDQLVRFAAAFFAMETATLPSVNLNSIAVQSRHNPSTRQVQLLTTDLLAVLERHVPTDAFALPGITMLDLYPDPSWNFVFGQASLHARVGVYSFVRYDPKFYGEVSVKDAQKLILRRSCKVLAHETCHLFGIEHCIWYRCVMNGSNHLDEADRRPLHLCPVDLRKLQSSVGFDVAQRYRRIMEFDAQAGFSDEADWLERRLRFVEGGK